MDTENAVGVVGVGGVVCSGFKVGGELIPGNVALVFAFVGDQVFLVGIQTRYRNTVITVLFDGGIVRQGSLDLLADIEGIRDYTAEVIKLTVFIQREHVLAAYEEAVREKYRFFSFGDAMFIS